MVESSAKRKEFSELNGKQFQLYLGTITYEISLGDYTQFIMAAAGSNEIQVFLSGVSNLQHRLNAIKAEYEGQIFKFDNKNILHDLYPEDTVSTIRDGFDNLSIEINELQVTELEFIEGSVKGRIKVVLKGTYISIPVIAGVVTIAGFDLRDFALMEKNRIYDQSCISFNGVGNHGNGNINIDVNVYNAPDKPEDMQTYFSKPDRVVDEFVGGVARELNISRPQAQPTSRTPRANPNN